MRNLKALKTTLEATIALARRRSSDILSLLKFHVTPRKIAKASCTFEHIGRGRGSVCATGHCFDAIFRSELTEGRAHAGSYSSVDSHTPFNWARQRTSFGTRGSQVQILPLRPAPSQRC